MTVTIADIEARVAQSWEAISPVNKGDEYIYYPSNPRNPDDDRAWEEHAMWKHVLERVRAGEAPIIAVLSR